MPHTLQAVADEHDANDHNGGSEIDWEETRFGLKAAPTTGVDVAGKVVNPVAGDLGEDGCDDGGEVEEAWLRYVLDVGGYGCYWGTGEVPKSLSSKA